MTTKIDLVAGGSPGLGKEMTPAAKGTLLLVAAILLAATSFGQTVWTTDKNHSQFHFSAFHFSVVNSSVVSSVRFCLSASRFRLLSSCIVRGRDLPGANVTKPWP